MKYGLSIFPTDYAIHPTDLGRPLEERGVEALWVVVVTGNHHHVSARLADAHEEAIYEPFGLGGWIAAIEHVSRVKDEIDCLTFDELREMLENSLHLVESLDAFPSAANVPIARVDNLHGPPSGAREGIFAKARKVGEGGRKRSWRSAGGGNPKRDQPGRARARGRE